MESAKPSYKILMLLKRRPGMPVDEFRRYYEDVHARLAAKYLNQVTRYYRRFLDPLPNPETGTNDELPYDVITEIWFENEAVYRGTVAYVSTSIMPADIIADEEHLFDRSKSRVATVVECETDLSTLAPSA